MAAIMPWLPITVQHDCKPNPVWSPYYPGKIDLHEKNFYELLREGVVTIYWYNCGVRKEKQITANVEFVSDTVEFTECMETEGTTGHGYVWEHNDRNAGEGNMKTIVGWSTYRHANPDLKSEFATEWRERCGI